MCGFHLSGGNTHSLIPSTLTRPGLPGDPFHSVISGRKSRATCLLTQWPTDHILSLYTVSKTVAHGFAHQARFGRITLGGPCLWHTWSHPHLILALSLMQRGLLAPLRSSRCWRRSSGGCGNQRLLTPSPGPRNVRSTCLPCTRSCPRTQPRNSKLLLRPSGQYM